MSERLTRKQLKEDHFIDLVQRAVSYARENPIVVGVAVIVFVGAVAAAVRIGGQAAGVGQGPDNPAAARALSDARQAFMGGDLSAGATALENVRQEFKRTEEGREATYVLANTYLEMGDYAKAEEAFRAFLAKPLYGDLLTDGAHSGVAACLEEKGDLDGA
ncbi:MAG: tetratricopeptide repeat protein, partial [Gemmatimonadetes bacterium]|nr:tetratricopeptide repeat protein [Gemmatimonadota bacterium]